MYNNISGFAEKAAHRRALTIPWSKLGHCGAGVCTVCFFFFFLGVPVEKRQGIFQGITHFPVLKFWKGLLVSVDGSVFVFSP